MNILNNKFYLGTLCHRNHKYEGSDRSLRYKRSNNCVECQKLYRQNNSKFSKRYNKWYYAKNKEQIKETNLASYHEKHRTKKGNIKGNVVTVN